MKTKRPWLGLLVILGPVLLVAMDGSILFLVMPQLTAELHPTADQSLWILDIYGFAVGSLLVAFGNLGDRLGRLKLLTAGAALFGLSSAAASFAQTPEQLIALRALMGIAGATLLPSALAVLGELFPDARQRSRAIGIFAATFAAGFAVGPVVAGQLLDRFWWGSVFLINLPVVVVFLLLAPFLLREVRAVRPGTVDAWSVVASAAGLLLTMYGVKHLAAAGFELLPTFLGVAGLAILWWFVRRQQHLDHPLVDLTLFRDRVFTLAIVTGLIPLAAWSATAYLAAIHLQSVLDLPVRTAALLAVPGAVVLTLTCILTPAAVARFSTRTALITCHTLIAAGLLPLLLLNATGGIPWYVASTVITAVGYGISFSVVADTAVAAVPPDRAGSAAALAETSNELGNALGIALLGSLAALIFRLTGPGLAGTLTQSLQTPDLPPEAQAAAKSAFVLGLHVTITLVALIHAGLAVLTTRWTRPQEPARP
ncbi:MFS transporter [Kribbella sandramycini]|uniref:MFS transporter n=1 Tax=Kribbella sandramycini TaxID=60450 RepID=A0A7Y4KYN0_9ACTN|nr:MFS transporter [Kribbella sandramycini]MBB6569057.1 DHA2 family multidrug resistance protein-like MFS transporter [Kribbella sandramycini]NOL41099.1 MFS transporter [Kribbella sandramycini]